MRPDRYSSTRKRCGGFTLFELVVVICLIVLLYQIAERRMNTLPAAAERASFHGVLGQIKTGVYMELIDRISSGDMKGVYDMAENNPMDYLLEPPGNYRGEVDDLNENLRRSSWYFDRTRKELVYLVSRSSIENVEVNVAGEVVYTGRVRLKLTSAYGEQNSRSLSSDKDDSQAGRLQGMLLVPVFPFEWRRKSVQAPGM